MTSLEISPWLRSSTTARALGVEHGADHLLVLARAVLVVVAVVVLVLAGAGVEAADAVRYSPRIRSTVSSRVHSSPSSSSRRSSAASVARRRASSSSRGLGAVVVHARPADHGGQREPLQHERREDHAEGDEQQLVARREVGGQRERGGQRDRAAHARPADDRPAAPASRAARAGSAAGRASGSAHVDHVHPDQPADDHHDRDHRGDRRSARPAARPRAPRGSAGSCRPISTNSSALSRNVRIVHIE